MSKPPYLQYSGFSILALLVLLFGSLAAVPASAQDGALADWSGTWETTWRDGGARLILEQNGTTVTGSYPLFDGSVEAVASGRELRGRWIQPDKSGTFLFVQSRDGRSFAGRFGTGEWWTGALLGNDSLGGPATALAADQSSPLAVMGAFLAAANESVDGDPESFGTAVSLVLPQQGARQDLDRFDRARRLFDVLDQATFRLWDLAGPHEGDSAIVTLNQAGTEESVSIPFRVEDGRWYLDPPPADALAATYDRLRAARQQAGGAEDGAGVLGSPRAAMRAFLLSFRNSPDGSSAATLAALDLRGRVEVTRAHEGQLLAGYLKRVIDRTGYVIWQEIPDDPLSRVPYVHFRHPHGDVVIAPRETQDGTVWQFTPETLLSIREVYAAMEDMPVAPGLMDLPDDDVRFAIRKTLRGFAPDALAPLGPLERWQWAGILFTILAALGGAWLAGRVTNLRQRGVAERDRHESGGNGWIDPWSVRGLATGLVLFGSGWVLGLPEGFNLILATAATVLVVVGVFALCWRGVGIATERYRRIEGLSGRRMIPFALASGVLRGLLLFATVFLLAHAFSLPITGVIAGLGIGGIAVALAVQPTLQNLLSGFTLYADRPVAVGDFCRFGDKMGTVEDIGLRSTRFRTLDRTVLTVPNSQFLDMQIENYAHRDRFLFTTVLQLRYETTADQMRFVLVELRKLLIAHPKVLPDPMRVRFASLGAHSLDVEVFSYVLAADLNEFTGIREDVLLRMMSIVDEAGAQFAFPSMVHYNAEDTAPDLDRVRRAEAHVEKWRATETLPFPDFEWQSKAELSGSLDYPPFGSALRRDDVPK